MGGKRPAREIGDDWGDTSSILSCRPEEFAPRSAALRGRFAKPRRSIGYDPPAFAYGGTLRRRRSGAALRYAGRSWGAWRAPRRGGWRGRHLRPPRAARPAADRRRSGWPPRPSRPSGATARRSLFVAFPRPSSPRGPP